MALPDFPIPEVHFFMNGNPFCGSLKGMNYRILPVKKDEEKGIEEHLEAYVWYGMLCSALSERAAQADFPMDEQGLAAAVDWLRRQYEDYTAAAEK